MSANEASDSTARHYAWHKHCSVKWLPAFSLEMEGLSDSEGDKVFQAFVSGVWMRVYGLRNPNTQLDIIFYFFF